VSQDAEWFRRQDGHRLAVQRIAGDDTLPVLVFLHEGLGCIAMWGDFPQRLCQQTGCSGLVYDRLGYGQSDADVSQRSVHYLHEAALGELPQVIRHYIGERDYVVIGHSDGGSIALMHAAAQPRGLRGVVTAAAHVFVEDMTLAGIRRAQAAYAKGKLNKLRAFHEDKTDALFCAWADIWLSAPFRHWNIEYLLAAISCPLLVTQGVDDQYGSRKQVDAIVSQSQGPAAALMLEDCAHAPHHEQGEQLTEHVVRFLVDIAE